MPVDKALFKRKPVPVRLDESDKKLLSALGEMTGIPEGTLIRYCVKVVMRHYEKHGSLPAELIASAKSLKPSKPAPAAPDDADSAVPYSEAHN